MYTVEISPPSWKQLAHLRVDTYRRIREELDAVAAQLTERRALELSPPEKVGDAPVSTPPVVVGDAVAVYAVDHERRRVVLREVVRRLPGDDCPGGGERQAS